jgi:hypothetical protein
LADVLYRALADVLYEVGFGSAAEATAVDTGASAAVAATTPAALTSDLRQVETRFARFR